MSTRSWKEELRLGPTETPPQGCDPVVEPRDTRRATIAEYIKSDLICRLRAGRGGPEPLTLKALSLHYGVSLTPVREAFRDLVLEGVLVRRSDGRVSVNPNLSRLKSRPDQPKIQRPVARTTDLEHALSREIIGKSLRGEAEYLREEATARRFRVGRTAVRQAFGRLEGQGLMIHVPRCGWRVRVFDAAEMSAFLEIRELLELKALELAIPRLDERELRRMLRGNDARPHLPRLDNSLHAYLVQTSKNRYIIDFFERHGAYYATLFDFATPETSVVAEMARQHREILQALIARDWPRARRMLARHIRSQKPIVEELLHRIGRHAPALEPGEATP